MNVASRTQNPSKAKRIEDEISQIDDVNLVFLWVPRPRSLACSLSVHRQLRPAFHPSSRSPALRAGNLRARSLARSLVARLGEREGERERERERDQNESLLVLCAFFLFQRLVLLCFCLTHTSLKFYYCISHVCCCHCCCVEVSNEAPGGGGCCIPVFFSRSSLCSSAAASVLVAAAAAVIKLVEFSSLVLTWREEEENYESDHQRCLVVV